MPWLAAIAIAPLLFGSVKPESQALVAFLLGLSLIFLTARGVDRAPGHLPFWLVAALGSYLLLQLLPLPAAIIHAIDPERYRLAQRFPLELNSISASLPLTLSPARSMQRLWELALAVAAFILAKQAFRSGLERPFIISITIALLCIAAHDLWARLTGANEILGLWSISWGRPTGTFGNRNHFANWIYTSSLFVFGWILRNLHPLHSARASVLARRDRRPLEPWLLALPITFALGMAVLSGSRGGLLAFAAGLAVWFILLSLRSRSKSRWLGISLGAIAAAAILTCAAGFLFHRIAQTVANPAAESVKLHLWKVAGIILARFPLTGSGLGTYLPASAIFKTNHGDIAFWHVENDYLEWLAETGALGALFLLAAAARLLPLIARRALRQPLPEPELFFGALAGLACFAVHSLYDFSFQIPANAILASCLLAYILSQLSGKPITPAPPHPFHFVVQFTGTLLLLVFAVLQGVSVWEFQRALRTPAPHQRLRFLQRSIDLWPPASEREITYARTAAGSLLDLAKPIQSRRAKSIRDRLQRAIAREPFNWELRLERAWFDLAFSSDPSLPIREAEEVIELSPSSPKIALQFARHFSNENPSATLQMLQRARLATETDVLTALAIAWSAKPDPAALWQLVPNTPDGLLAVARFSIDKELFPMAMQALEQLQNRAPAELLGRLFIDAHAPERAVEIISPLPPNAQRQLLLARAYRNSGAYLESIQHAEWILVKAGRPLANSSDEPLPPSVLSDAKITLQQKRSPELAAQAAESIALAPPEKRDISFLQSLAQQYPEQLRIQWLLYHTQLDLQQFPAAAATAIDLAERLL